MFARHLDYLDAELSRRPWFAGEEFTAADVMMSFPLEAARARAGLDERRRNLTWNGSSGSTRVRPISARSPKGDPMLLLEFHRRAMLGGGLALAGVSLAGFAGPRLPRPPNSSRSPFRQRSDGPNASPASPRLVR